MGDFTENIVVCSEQRNLILSSLIKIANMEQYLSLGKTLLLCLFLSLLQFGNSLPATEADVDPTVSPTDDGCEAFRDDCNGCVTAPAGCMFVTYKDTSETCVAAADEDPTSDAAPVTVARNTSECESGGEPDVTTIIPTPGPDPSNDTTTTTTTTIFTTTESTTETTTAPSTTTPVTSTSTSTSTSTEAPTARPSPDPNSRGHFDGWSFFGGILLTLGMAAIGFVGFKYYKLRSSSGGNYNRF